MKFKHCFQAGEVIPSVLSAKDAHLLTCTGIVPNSIYVDKYFCANDFNWFLTVSGAEVTRM